MTVRYMDVRSNIEKRSRPYIVCMLGSNFGASSTTMCNFLGCFRV